MCAHVSREPSLSMSLRGHSCRILTLERLALTTDQDAQSAQQVHLPMCVCILALDLHRLRRAAASHGRLCRIHEPGSVLRLRREDAKNLWVARHWATASAAVVAHANTVRAAATGKRHLFRRHVHDFLATAAWVDLHAAAHTAEIHNLQFWLALRGQASRKGGTSVVRVCTLLPARTGVSRV